MVVAIGCLEDGFGRVGGMGRRGQRKTLDQLCPLWVRRSIEAVEVELRCPPPYSPDLNPIKKAW